MAAVVGYASLFLAFLLALYGIAALLRGHRLGDERWLTHGRRAAVGVLAFVSVAVAMLEVSLIRGDFSIRYVASNVSLATPLLFRVIGLWGALEGSILFWQWLLALFGAIVAVRYRRRYQEIMPYVVSVLFGISAFFLFLMLGPANPFARLALPPPDGRGLNPLLQNHPLMAIHPPFLYLGYVGFSVPYAFAMGALLAGRLRDEWMTITRRWTLLAWTFLTGGLFLGARWSYDVLGWGGYWGWDPVENAALLPWLVGTALVHSTMVQERRHLLRIWNLALVIVTFVLTIFGTFLTRSGIIASVHSFTQSLIGPFFLSFLTIALVFSLTALQRRLPTVRDEGSFDTYLSREALMVLNNVLLLTMAFTVFFGTVFPLFVEAATGEKITIGPPFFNRVFVPLGLGLLIVMGAGTLLRWGRSGRDDMRRLVLVAGGAVTATVLLGISGVRGAVTLTALGIVTFTALAQLDEFYQGVRASQAGTGDGAVRSLLALFRMNRQRYFGYLTHLGLAITVAGIIASVSYRLETVRSLAVGEGMPIGPYFLRYDGLQPQARPDKIVIAAHLSVFTRSLRQAGLPAGSALAATGGETEPVVILQPSENFYPRSREPVASPAVRSTWRDDLYVVLVGFDPNDRTAVIKAITSPLVAWIWAGGLIMVAAGVLNLWSVARRP